ncbi:MAG: hypothetical protein WC798_00735 [Candidatus Paceibacterota bacterium]|jgi:hypothetical protein
MKNSQKGFIAPLLIIIIAVLAIGAGVYYYSSKNGPSNTNGSLNSNQTPPITTDNSVNNNVSTQNPVVQPPTSPANNSSGETTTGWKTYSNAQFNFSFKYPPDWGFSGELGSNSKPYQSPYVFGSLLQKNLAIIHIDVLNMSMDSLLKVLAEQNPKGFKTVVDFSSASFSGKEYISDEKTLSHTYLLDLNGKIIKIEPSSVGGQTSQSESQAVDSVSQMVAKTFSTSAL